MNQPRLEALRAHRPAVDHLPQPRGAAAGHGRFWLSPEIARCPPGEPERTFVIYMCAYAGDVLRGELPGPYSDHDAVRYARAALIPERLLHRPGMDVERVAQAFGIPAQELAAARDERRRESAA